MLIVSKSVFSSEHDTGGRILLVTFPAEQKRVRRAEIFTQSLYFFVNVHYTSLLKCTRGCT